MLWKNIFKLGVFQHPARRHPFHSDKENPVVRSGVADPVLPIATENGQKREGPTSRLMHGVTEAMELNQLLVTPRARVTIEY
jgi:hypothetical protein